MKKQIIFIISAVIILASCASSPSMQTVYMQKDPDYSGPGRTSDSSAAQNNQRAGGSAQPATRAGQSADDELYNQRLRDLKYLYDRKNFTAPPIATVMNFNSQGLSALDAQFISDYLSSALYNTKAFRIIDRNQRETLLQELSFSMSGCSEESCQLEMGRLLSADKIVVGNLGKISSRFIMDVRMIDVSSGETVSVSNKIYNSMDELIDDSRFIAVNLTEGFLLDN
ncbi:MAG: hypothetical protein JEZ04_09455 [Spirochaetales bacterium]|nr:hypothetical protein [Spirochaetales bacterium]